MIEEDTRIRNKLEQVEGVFVEYSCGKVEHGDWMYLCEIWVRSADADASCCSGVC